MTKTDIASVFIATVAVYGAFVFSLAQASERNISDSVTVNIGRKVSRDFYELSSHEENKINHIFCEENQTYMVEEKICLKNEDIIGSEFNHHSM